MHALLKAAGDVADRGEGRDRDAHSIVIKSLARQRAPLESAITATLNARDPLATGWFWAVPYPPSLHNLLQALERDARFGVCTATREAAAKPGGSEGLLVHCKSAQSLCVALSESAKSVEAKFQ